MANSARIDELRKKFDENPRRYFAPLANEYRKSGDLAQAIFILEEYLPQQQGHISGHIVYGQTLFELGRDEEAKRVFETALALDPENLIALRHLGHISRQAGDFDAARSWYQRLLEADPRDVEIEQLVGSLDSAAQAQAASLSASAAVESVPPPPAPMPEPDDAPFRVERAADHDGTVVEVRSSTHPLAPPPLSFSTGAAHDEAVTPADSAVTPADSMEAASGPPPLPTRVAEEAPAPEPGHELLDLNDFSFGSPPAAADAASAYEPPAVSHEISDDDEAFRSLGDEVSVDVHDLPRVESSWTDPEPARESTVESSAEEPDATDPIPRDMPVGFEPFSGLDSLTPESEPEPVGGFESYTFESPEGPVAEPAADVISFPSAGTFPTPSEPVEPTEGFESVEMQFAAGVDADAARADDAEQSEHSGQHEEPIGDVHEVNAVDEREVGATPSSTSAISTPIVASTPVVGSSAVSAAGNRRRRRRVRDRDDGPALHGPRPPRVRARHLSHTGRAAPRRRIAAPADRRDRGSCAAPSTRTDAADAGRRDAVRAEDADRRHVEPVDAVDSGEHAGRDAVSRPDDSRFSPRHHSSKWREPSRVRRVERWHDRRALRRGETVTTRSATILSRPTPSRERSRPSPILSRCAANRRERPRTNCRSTPCFVSRRQRTWATAHPVDSPSTSSLRVSAAKTWARVTHRVIRTTSNNSMRGSTD